MGKEYKLKTLADVRKVVNEQNIAAFLKDFEAWLRYVLRNKYENN